MTCRHVLAALLLVAASPSRGAGVPVLSFPPIDRAALLERDAARAGAGPLRFAEPIAVLVTPATDGTWEERREGGRAWRLDVEVPEATDLNFGFRRFDVPEGALLTITNASGTYMAGPYAKGDGADGQLWTAVVPGSTARIELTLPGGAPSPVLELSQIGAGYRDFLGLGDDPRPMSGACNNDVACPEGAPWAAEIRSAVKYSLFGTETCSGTLLADVPGSLRPFVLTANHCGVDAGGAATIVAYWNFQASACGGARNGAANQVTQSGATFRASLVASDMALFELTSAPPPGADAYWSGWDRSDAAPQAAVAIHHPSLDEKAITFDDHPLTRGENCIENPGAFPGTHWYVGQYEDGTTEPGSSGSGIWDAGSKLLVGTLSGGWASCDSVLNGDPTDDFDCWGRFAHHWDAGSASATRLRDWLDPAGTGATSAPGRSLQPPEILLEEVTVLDACALGAGDGNGTAEPGESVTLVVRLRAQNGAFTNVRGVLDTTSPDVTLVDPAATFPDFELGTAKDSDAPHLRLAVASGAACGASAPLTLRVRANEGGPFDLPIDLPVGEPSPAPSVPLPMADSTITTSPLDVTADVVLTSLAVRVRVAHPRVGDLRLTLQHPDGTQVVLLDRPGVPAVPGGCTDDDLHVTFTERSAFSPENHCIGATPWYEGEARPVGVLDALLGRSARGQWQLIARDMNAGSSGTLLDWELVTTPPLSAGCLACTASPCPGVEIASVTPDVLYVTKGPGGSVVLTHPGARSACAAGVQVRMAATARPSSGSGSWPLDPPFGDVTPQDLDPGAPFRHVPPAGTQYYLVVEDVGGGSPGPSGSY